MRPIPILRGWSWSHLHPLTVKAGGATRVVYGGTGRPLIGKVVLSDSQRKIEWPGGHHSLTTRFAQPPPDQRTPEGWRAWQRTPEDKQALANHRTRAPTWQPDGSFRLDEVLPGRFQLSLRFTDPRRTLPSELDRFHYARGRGAGNSRRPDRRAVGPGRTAARTALHVAACEDAGQSFGGVCPRSNRAGSPGPGCAGSGLSGSPPMPRCAEKRPAQCPGPCGRPGG